MYPITWQLGSRLLSTQWSELAQMPVPERFESMTSCTSDPYRTLRVLLTSVHSVEAVG
uniref:Uncharacterized protein n=1 Tax=Arundo donax TaxID=35708 RepID=A0A0A9H6F5_ARUDO